MNAISNNDDVIDSREVIERLEELRGLLDDESSTPAHNLTDEEIAEMEALDALAGEASSAADWEYGVTLIRDSHFQDYARELADELGLIPTEYSWPTSCWPTSCIDWEQAARELRMDYWSVDFDGVTYWVR